MANAIDSVDVKVQVREVGDTTWKTLVCEIDSQFQLSNETTETDTKCGTFFGVKVAKGNNSGNAVFNATPGANEVSYDDVANWQINRTALEMLVENEAFTGEDGTSYTEGQVIHYFYSGKFVDSTLTGPVGEVMKFSWTFKPTGTPNIGGTSS